MYRLISTEDLNILAVTIVCSFVLWILSKHYKNFTEITNVSEDDLQPKEKTQIEKELIEELNNIATLKSIETDPSKYDDFIAIEGVGPKINELLHNSNIHTFETLAYTSVDDLQRILDNAGHHFKMANPKTWPEQARLASEGDWERLRDYQDMLYSGI
jgi:predicted flap endonuclease-1-like 5' DNA nuclease